MEQVNPLKVGMKLTHKELADWFGIVPQTLSTRKDKFFNVLGYYADYHLEGQKIVIDDVYEAIYQKEKPTVLKIMKKIEGGTSQELLLACFSQDNVERAFELVNRKKLKLEFKQRKAAISRELMEESLEKERERQKLLNEERERLRELQVQEELEKMKRERLRIERERKEREEMERAVRVYEEDRQREKELKRRKDARIFESDKKGNRSYRGD